MKLCTTLLGFNDRSLFILFYILLTLFVFISTDEFLPVILENSIKQINFHIFELMILFYYFKIYYVNDIKSITINE